MVARIRQRLHLTTRQQWTDLPDEDKEYWIGYELFIQREIVQFMKSFKGQEMFTPEALRIFIESTRLGLY